MVRAYDTIMATNKNKPIKGGVELLVFFFISFYLWATFFIYTSQTKGAQSSTTNVLDVWDQAFGEAMLWQQNRIATMLSTIDDYKRNADAFMFNQMKYQIWIQIIT